MFVQVCFLPGVLTCRESVHANVKCDNHNSRISFVFVECRGYMAEEVSARISQLFSAPSGRRIISMLQGYEYKLLICELIVPSLLKSESGRARQRAFMSN